MCVNLAGLGPPKRAPQGLGQMQTMPRIPKPCLVRELPRPANPARTKPLMPQGIATIIVDLPLGPIGRQIPGHRP